MKTVSAIARNLSALSSLRSKPLVLNIPRADIYRFGDGDSAKPVFSSLDWKIEQGQSWAIVGFSAKQSLIELLTGHLRVNTPPPGGIYPFLEGRDIYEQVSLVSFTSRPRSSSGGAFYDFTARYGALRDEDKILLKDSFVDAPSQEELYTLSSQLDVDRLLHLPLIALSNGQTRRARILGALLKKPKILLLDEPFTGLDTHHRPRLSELLQKLHANQSPIVIMALRPQDPIPTWVTHVLCVDSTGTLEHGPIKDMRNSVEDLKTSRSGYDHNPNAERLREISAHGTEVISMRDVNVSYQDRHILKGIDWSIRAGERWHLQGANGSGKTTLTSLLNGTHPQSYTQRHLHIFGKPRMSQPTVLLQRQIGHVSPELFSAFPRKMSGLSVRECIATGFDGTFVYRKRTIEEDTRIEDLVSFPSFDLVFKERSKTVSDWLDTPFAAIPHGEQSLALLLRALVNRPRLLILDEAFAGMDDNVVSACTKYLREVVGGDQAIVFVGHWENEIPWTTSQDSLKVFRLEG